MSIPRKKNFGICLFLLCLGFGAQSQEASRLSVHTHVKVVNLTKAAAPEIFEGEVIFSSDLRARYVGIGFAHEQFKTIHPLKQNRHGIFFLVYPIPIKMKDPLRYRMVVDGIWTYDQRNPWRETAQESGVSLSTLSLPYLSDEEPGLYSILGPDGRTARFRYRGESGELITVAGSFNEWDPFMYKMEETAPGLYQLELELPRGLQRYAFITQGRKIPDPLNPALSYSQEGSPISILDVR